MSSVRRFKRITEDKMKMLKQEQVKRRTYAKVQWAVKAFKEWRNNRLSDAIGFDVRVYECDIDQVECLEKDTFEYAMCKFLAEVTKVKDGSDYPGTTLYQLCVSIQKYLLLKGKNWKLVEGGQFIQLRTVLDNLMKEHAQCQLGTVKRQAGVISLNIENDLWEKGVLGEENPEQLRNTVLFLLGLNVGLRAGDEHYALRLDSPNLPSQLTFERNENGVRCLVYREDSTTKMNDGGLKHMIKERKVVWVYPSENTVRCPVRLVDKYMSLVPQVGPQTKKHNFYLRGLEKITPAQWYGEQVMGLNTIRKVVKEMLKGLEGFYSNHSLRRTSTTRLFRSGIDRKLVKEFTGHSSDAVDAYQITSDNQRAEMSNIISGGKKEKVSKKQQECQSEMEFSIVSNDGKKPIGCSCNTQAVKLSESEKIGTMISNILERRQGGKAKIKLEIEFC